MNSPSTKPTSAPENLRDFVVCQRPLTVAQATRLVHAIARALQIRHRHPPSSPESVPLPPLGYVSPSWIMVRAEGLVELQLPGQLPRELTGDELGYCSPQMIVDPEVSDPANEVYSLGCLAFFIFTQRPPFTGSELSIQREHAAAPRPSLRAARSDVPDEIDQLVRRMLCVVPEERPRLDDVVAALVPLAGPGEPVTGEPVVGEVVTTGEVIQDAGHDEGEPFEDAIPILPVTSIVKRPPGSDEPTAPLELGHAVTYGDAFPVGLPEEKGPWRLPPAPRHSPPIPPQPIPDTSPVPEKASPAKKPTRSERLRRKRMKLVSRTIMVLLGCLVMTGVAFLLRPRPDPVAAWKKVDEQYRTRKFSDAAKGFKRFRETFPGDSRAEDVPFLLEACELGPSVFFETGNPDVGLTKLQDLYQKHRDTPQYERYAADFFEASQQLVGRFLRQAERGKSRLPNLEKAREAFGLLTTVGEAIKEDWVAEVIGGEAQKLELLEQKARLATATEELLTLVATARDPERSFAEVDELYAEIRTRLAASAELSASEEIQKAVSDCYRDEARRVTYEARVDDAPFAEPTIEPDEGSIFIVSDQDTPPQRVAGQVRLALARGILYAFDSDGQHLWSRRLGLDAHHKPVMIPATTTSPASVLAIDTLQNKLIALNQFDGSQLWEYAAGHTLSASLTVCEWTAGQPRGLLPTADGEIHVLELTRGRRIGLFSTGGPLAVGGTYDPATKLIYFPADAQRIFALDPAAIDAMAGLPAETTLEQDRADVPRLSAARSTLITRHASGSLRSPPLIIGSYLILIEAADLDTSRVRVYELRLKSGFDDPQAAPIKTLTLRGWTWFQPPHTPDRITVVTDDGEVGVFGLNLDHPDEALYPIIEDGQGNLPRLPIGGSFRALAVQSDERLLWVMAGGQLRHYALDIPRQKVVPLWPLENGPAKDGGAAVTGIPLHEADFDWDEDRIYVTARAPDGDQIYFHAVDATTGRVVWRRELGLQLATDPIALDDRVAMIDAGGRIHHAEYIPATDATSATCRVLTSSVVADSGPGEMTILRDARGRSVQLTVAPDRQELFLRPLLGGASGELPTRRVRLPGIGLRGRPAILGNVVLVPCADGRLHRLPLNGRGSDVNDVPFSWAQESTLAPDHHVSVYPLTDDQVLLVNGRQLSRLAYAIQENVGRWRTIGTPFLAERRLRGEPLIVDQTSYVADERGNFYAIPAAQFAEGAQSSAPPVRSHRLPGNASSGPLRYRDTIVVLLGGRRLAAFAHWVSAADGTSTDQAAEAETITPQWITEPTTGRICGQPVLLGNSLLVTDELGSISVYGLEQGKLRRELRLPTGIVPAAAAIPLGTSVIVPLADGSLIQRSLKAFPTADKLSGVSSEGARP